MPPLWHASKEKSTIKQTEFATLSLPTNLRGFQSFYTIFSFDSVDLR